MTPENTEELQMTGSTIVYTEKGRELHLRIPYMDAKDLVRVIEDNDIVKVVFY